MVVCMRIKLVLASKSLYKKTVLEKLKIPFTALDPDIDESVLAQESAKETALRLAVLKAQKIAGMVDDGLVLGLDQTVSFNEEVIGKPHTKDNAIKQLLSFSNNKVSFYTSICLLNKKDNSYQTATDIAHAHFRKLTLNEITNYVNQDMPLDCAGSFKSEGLGIGLLKSLDTKDPNGIVGLPLIELVSMLNKAGYSIFE